MSDSDASPARTEDASPARTDDPSPARDSPPSPSAADDKAADSKPADEVSPAKSDAARTDDASPTKSEPAADPSPETQKKMQRSVPRQKAGPSVSTVTYPGQPANLSVVDMLDPSKPLVKSTLPLTKPKGPSFVEEVSAEHRREKRLETKLANTQRTHSIEEQRNNERKYLKAQHEFEREKRLAEKAIYHRERVAQWATRLGSSPLGVDLVADHERIDEEAQMRAREEHRRKVLAERRKRKIKNEIIVKALAEVPLLEEARRQKREMLEEERREKAIRDVQRVEAIQSRKLRDIKQMADERQQKLDHRLMSH